MGNIEFPFMGGAYTARSLALNAQVCQNLYPEIDDTGAKNVISLTNVPGEKTWKDTGSNGEVREWTILNGYLYVVSGNTLYKIDSNKTQTTIDTIGTSSGWCDITNDGTNLLIIDSTGGWSMTNDVLTSVSVSGFPSSPGSATYQNGYHVVSTANSNSFQVSSLTSLGDPDPTTWNSKQIDDAETVGDNIVHMETARQQLWILKERSIEIWYYSAETFPFSRNPGGVLNVGCGAKRSVSIFEDTLFWLDDKGRVVRSNGLSYVPISTYHIEFQISLLSNFSDAVGFCYHQEGHVFYELTIGNKTFCYDLKTQLWHTRAHGQNDIRSRANRHIYFNDKNLVGDYQNGKIYEYDLDTYDSDGGIKRAIRTCQYIAQNRQRVFFNSVEFDMEAGVGIATGQGSDPQMMLTWSDDRGRTWSNEHWLSIGKIGEYDKRVIKRRLGSSRNRIFKVVITDPVKRRFINAYLDGEITDG